MLILVNFWICLGICNVLYVQTWYVQSILISWNQMVVIRMLVSIPKILICDVLSASKIKLNCNCLWLIIYLDLWVD